MFLFHFHLTPCDINTNVLNSQKPEQTENSKIFALDCTGVPNKAATERMINTVRF